LWHANDATENEKTATLKTNVLYKGIICALQGDSSVAD